MNSNWHDRIGLQYPVMQAGMGGGLSTAELTIAVGQAGGLGTIGLLPPQRFAEELHHAKRLCNTQPIAANLLMPFVRRAHVDACVEIKPAVTTLFYGYSRRVVAQLRSAGIFVFHQIGNPAQAQRALADGADGLIAQGSEAGGHLAGNVLLSELLPAVREIAGRHPVLAAGGIHDAETVHAAMTLGADGVVAGTRFLLTTESHAHPEYKTRLLGATRTLNTRLFGMGWPAPHRVATNAATMRWCSRRTEGPVWVQAVNTLSVPSRWLLSLNQAERLTGFQQLAVPLYLPNALIRTMDACLADVTPLYAGICVGQITKLCSAADAVRELAAGVG